MCIDLILYLIYNIQASHMVKMNIMRALNHCNMNKTWFLSNTSLSRYGDFRIAYENISTAFYINLKLQPHTKIDEVPNKLHKGGKKITLNFTVVVRCALKIMFSLAL